jgi:hypothetical protein
VAFLTVSLGELGAAEIDGEDDGFAVVDSFLELLKEKGEQSSNHRHD